MKGWWIPWTFPLVLLGVVGVFGVFGDDAILVLTAVGVVAIPLLWRLANPIDDPDADVNYWRFQAPWRP